MMGIWGIYRVHLTGKGIIWTFVWEILIKGRGLGGHGPGDINHPIVAEGAEHFSVAAAQIAMASADTTGT